MSANTIKEVNKRIKEDGGFNQIIELNLSDLTLKTISSDLRKVLQKTKAVEVVLLSDNQLQNLDNLPDWELSALDISNNKLTDNALIRVAKFKNIAQILALNNKISTLQGLASLFILKHLQEIDLTGNPVTEIAGYRDHLFQKIPTLRILDGRNAAGELVEEEPDAEAADDAEIDDSDEEDFEDEEEDEYDQEQSQSPQKKKK